MCTPDSLAFHDTFSYGTHSHLWILQTRHSINTQCFKCSSTLIGEGNGQPYNISDNCASLWTPYQYTVQLFANNSQELDSTMYTFGEYGKYVISVDPGFTLSVVKVEKPDNPYIPLYVLFSIISFLVLVSYCFPWLVKKLKLTTLNDTVMMITNDKTALKLEDNATLNYPILSTNAIDETDSSNSHSVTEAEDDKLQASPLPQNSSKVYAC